jgi:hypothetical protein
MHSGEFDLHDYHKIKFEFCSWNGGLIHANTTKAIFGCNEVHIEIHKTHFCSVEFIMKAITNYKRMDTWMLIRLAMFQI